MERTVGNVAGKTVERTVGSEVGSEVGRMAGNKGRNTCNQSPEPVDKQLPLSEPDF